MYVDEENPRCRVTHTYTCQLRDLFTIHHHTGCHTHDLLECTCSARDRCPEIDEHSFEDVADISGEEGDMGGSLSGFTIASQVKPENLQRMDKAVSSITHTHTLSSVRLMAFPWQYASKKKAELAALGEWTHINCLHPSARTNIHDSILKGLIYLPPSVHEDLRPPQTSRIESLLDAVDLENIAMTDANRLTVDDVPGGSISFLFEKGSNSLLSSATD